MDKMKKALRQKMGHQVTISIAISPEQKEREKEKKSDLAPTVMDSDEPGVDKGDMRMDMEGVENLMEMTPQSMGKGMPSLHDRARKKMGDRLTEMKSKKGLKV